MFSLTRLVNWEQSPRRGRHPGGPSWDGPRVRVFETAFAIVVLPGRSAPESCPIHSYVECVESESAETGRQRRMNGSTYLTSDRGSLDPRSIRWCEPLWFVPFDRLAIVDGLKRPKRGKT